MAAGTGVAAAAPPAEAGDEDCVTCEGRGEEIQSVEDLEAAFAELGALSDDEVVATAIQVQESRGESVPEGLSAKPAVIPIVAIGVKTLISCALSAAWVFRDGDLNSGNAAMRVAEVIVGCVGIPGATWDVTKLAVLVWKYRKKIAAALSAAGLTAAQLAPLRNARHP